MGGGRGALIAAFSVAALELLAAYAWLLGAGVPGRVMAAVYSSVAIFAVVPAVAAGLQERGRQRRAWLLIASSQVVWFGGDSWYWIADLLGRDVPFPGPPDALYYAGYAGLTYGLISLTGSWRGLGKTALADGSVVFLAVATFSSHYLLIPTIRDAEPELLPRMVAAGYPALDLGLFAALLLAVYGGRQTRDPAIVALGLGLAMLAATDSLYAQAALTGADPSAASWRDLGWILAYLLVGLAGMLRLRFEAAPETRPHGPEELWRAALPYAAMLPLSVDGLRRIETGQDASVFVAGGIAASLVVFGRQLLTLSDNRRLHREQEALNGALRARVNDLTSLAEELDNLRARAEHQANEDMLTGLLNRRGWFEQVQPLRASAIAVIDIDDFKAVNDTYGHDVGDAVLAEVGRRLSDWLPWECVSGRLGGEEFGVLFRAQRREVMRTCQDFLHEMARTPIQTDAAPITCTVSIGLTYVGAREHLVLESAYVVADRCLYEAKRRGKNQLAAAPCRFVA